MQRRDQTRNRIPNTVHQGETDQKTIVEHMLCKQFVYQFKVFKLNLENFLASYSHFSINMFVTLFLEFQLTFGNRQPYRYENGLQVCNSCDRAAETSQERANALIKITFNFIMVNTPSFFQFKISNFLQALVLLFMFVSMCYIIWDDVKNKLETKMQIQASRINQCQLDYESNKCAPPTRLPALEEYCQNLDICRFENPRSVVMTSSTITILVAEVINGFISTLAAKSLVVIFTFLFG